MRLLFLLLTTLTYAQPATTLWQQGRYPEALAKARTEGDTLTGALSLGRLGDWRAAYPQLRRQRAVEQQDGRDGTELMLVEVEALVGMGRARDAWPLADRGALSCIAEDLQRAHGFAVWGVQARLSAGAPDQARLALRPLLQTPKAHFRPDDRLRLLWLALQLEPTATERQTDAWLAEARALFDADAVTDPRLRGVLELALDRALEQKQGEKAAELARGLLAVDAVFEKRFPHFFDARKTRYTPDALRAIADPPWADNRLALILLPLLLTDAWLVRRMARRQRQHDPKPAQRPRPGRGTPPDDAAKRAAALGRLRAFERQKAYLKPGFGLSQLAKALGMNRTYAVAFIEAERGMPVPRYLDTLRIAHACHLLETQPRYRHFSLSGLAQECGFGTARTFVKVFSEQKGLHPRDFSARFE